jgi:hypothetical protein
MLRSLVIKNPSYTRSRANGDVSGFPGPFPIYEGPVIRSHGRDRGRRFPILLLGRKPQDVTIAAERACRQRGRDGFRDTRRMGGPLAVARKKPTIRRKKWPLTPF